MPPIQIVLAIIWCWCAISNSLVTNASNDQLIDKLELVCKSKVDAKTIAEFRQFMNDLNSIVSKDEQQLRTSNLKKNLIKCFDERESLVALEQLVDSYDRVRPCKMSQLERLEQFARKHLFNNKKALAAKFFSLFGVQIALTCKLNLMAHTKQADLEADQLDFIYAMASPTGWNVLVNEYTKKSMKFGTSGNADSHIINRVARLVPGLTQIDQLDYLSFDHVMNQDMPEAKDGTDWDGHIERGQYEPQSLELRKQLVDSIAKIITSCQALDMFYVNSLLAMARLKELGLMVDYLNELHEHSPVLHKWLVATSFCQLMARVKLTATTENDSPLHVEIIHDDKLLVTRRKLYSYVAAFDEITDRAREYVWHTSVNEGAWRRKRESMWPPGSGGTSVAMRQLKQFMKGVEHNFKEVEQEKQTEAG